MFSFEYVEFLLILILKGKWQMWMYDATETILVFFFLSFRAKQKHLFLLHMRLKRINIVYLLLIMHGISGYYCFMFCFFPTLEP